MHGRMPGQGSDRCQRQLGGPLALPVGPDHILGAVQLQMRNMEWPDDTHWRLRLRELLAEYRRATSE